jgi:hypothetical protein
MDEPVHGILGRDAELAQVTSFVSAPGGPSALILEGTAGIGLVRAVRRRAFTGCPSARWVRRR